jgi:O-antigen ligase
VALVAPPPPGAPEPGAEAAVPSPPRERHSRRPLRWSVALAYFGIVILRPGLPQNLAYADIVIAMLTFIGLVWMTRQGSLATELLNKCGLWIWFIVLGGLIGLAGVGIPLWAISNVGRLLTALLAFFALLHLFVTRRPLLKYAVIGTFCGFMLTIVWLAVVDGFGSVRPTAFFQHPNYPGHYVVAAGVVLFAYYRSVPVRVFIVGMTALGVFATASFGAMAMGFTVVAVVLFRLMGRQLFALLVVVVSAIFLGTLLFGIEVQLDEADPTAGLNVNDTINEDRFERSRASRFDLWADGFEQWTRSPWGVGPDGAKKREIVHLSTQDKVQEIHADALGYLVERGPLGLIGYVALWLTLWTFAERKGVARMLMVSLLVAGLFRETMHYRHAWLLLAAAFAIDYWRRRDRGDVDAADAADAAVAPA